MARPAPHGVYGPIEQPFIQRETWYAPLGEFVFAFGEIEFWVNRAIECFGPQGLEKTTRDLNLAKRVDIAELLAKAALKTAEAKPWERVFAKVRRLSSTVRNPVAHSAPMGHVFVRPGAGGATAVQMVSAIIGRKPSLGKAITWSA